MRKSFKKIGILIAVAVTLIGIKTSLAANIFPVTPALFDTALSVPQQTTDTTLTLVTAPNILAGDYVCLAIDSGLTTLEYECGTASTTPTYITGLIRGLDFRAGTTTITSNIFYHRSGADARITTFPVLTLLSNQLNGTNPFLNIISYASTTPTNFGSSTLNIPSLAYILSLINSATSTVGNNFLNLTANGQTVSGANTFSQTQTFTATQSFNNGAIFSTLSPTIPNAVSGNQAVNLNQLNATAIAGAPIATNIVTGIGRVASSTQISAAFSSTTPYLIPSSLASSTASTTASIIVATNPSTGLIDNSFFSSFFYFGNGRDGPVTIAANSTTTLTRDMYYTNLTINGTLVEDGYRVFVNGTINGTGVLTWGNTSTDGSATTTGGIFRNEAGGVAGGSNTNGAAALTATTTCGSNGGTGVNGNTNATSTPYSVCGLYAFNTLYNMDIATSTMGFRGMFGGMGGGGGGNSGGGTGNVTGGQGGSGCGSEFLSANIWAGSFTIFCQGGIGLPGQVQATNSNGGGGGGSGGSSFVIYGTKTWTGIYSLLGGIGGVSSVGQGSQVAATGYPGISYESQINNLIR